MSPPVYVDPLYREEMLLDANRALKTKLDEFFPNFRANNWDGGDQQNIPYARQPTDQGFFEPLPCNGDNSLHIGFNGATQDHMNATTSNQNINTFGQGGWMFFDPTTEACLVRSGN